MGFRHNMSPNSSHYQEILTMYSVEYCQNEYICFQSRRSITMKVSLKGHSHQNYVCHNERGDTLGLSGDKSGVSPMESVLMAGAACSAVDIEIILDKMRQPLQGIEAEVEGTRADNPPKVFTKIHIHYILKGQLKEEKVKEAIDMSVSKYCSVLTMLENTAVLTTSFSIID